MSEYLNVYLIPQVPYFKYSTTVFEDENVDFVPKMKALVEETFTNGQNQKVVLLAHSMGSLYGLHFLNNQTVAWKRKYIKAFVVASAPLGGSIKALKIEASGKFSFILMVNLIDFVPICFLGESLTNV